MQNLKLQLKIKNFSFCQRILATVNYFDIFDYPLTLIEVYKYLINNAGDRQIEQGINLFGLAEYLNQLCRAGLMDSLNGFYFLAGRSQIAKLRINRYKLSQSKYKKAIKISQLLKFIPGIRLIAICNNLAYNNSRQGSDIDLFIITSKRRIWFVRFFCNLILSVLGQRPKLLNTEEAMVAGKFSVNQINQDKICNSFFITENNLNLEPYKICDNDWYLMFWLQQIKPIYDQNNLYKKFVQANCRVKKFFPYKFSENNFIFYQTIYRSFLDSQLKNFFDKLAINLDEKFYKWLQFKLMPKKLKQLSQKSDSRVIIADNILKFHQNDRRLEYNQEFDRRLRGIANLSLI